MLSVDENGRTYKSSHLFATVTKLDGSNHSPQSWWSMITVQPATTIHIQWRQTVFSTLELKFSTPRVLGRTNNYNSEILYQFYVFKGIFYYLIGVKAILFAYTTKYLIVNINCFWNRKTYRLKWLKIDIEKDNK